MIADNLKTISDNIPKVYEAGKKSQYDEFWDEFQDNGKRRNYEGGFSGYGWTNKTFKPKYPLNIEEGRSMFAHAEVTRLPRLDISNISTYTNLFVNAQALEIVEEIVLFNGLRDNYSMFLNCYNLKEIKFVGFFNVMKPIYLNNSSLLSKNSIISLVNALSPDSQAKSVELKKTAVDKAFETSTGANDGSTSQEWADLIATKPTWTISLV